MSPTSISKTSPLYHLRKGTQNVTGPAKGVTTDEHDSYSDAFAVGDAERDSRLALGFALFGPPPVAFVFTSDVAR